MNREGNSLINELIIGTGSKDLFSVSEPERDHGSPSFFLDPLLSSRLLLGSQDSCPSGTSDRLTSAGAVRCSYLSRLRSCRPGPCRGSAAPEYGHPSNRSRQPETPRLSRR